MGSLDLITSNSRFLFCHLVNPLRLPSASKSQSCRWPLRLWIRLVACLSYVILPIHSDLAIRRDDSTLVFHCLFTSIISPRCVLPRSSILPFGVMIRCLLFIVFSRVYLRVAFSLAATLPSSRRILLAVPLRK